jgi:hypothetical protein
MSDDLDRVRRNLLAAESAAATLQAVAASVVNGTEPDSPDGRDARELQRLAGQLVWRLGLADGRGKE